MHNDNNVEQERQQQETSSADVTMETEEKRTSLSIYPEEDKDDNDVITPSSNVHWMTVLNYRDNMFLNITDDDVIIPANNPFIVHPVANEKRPDYYEMSNWDEAFSQVRFTCTLPTGDKPFCAVPISRVIFLNAACANCLILCTHTQALQILAALDQPGAPGAILLLVERRAEESPYIVTDSVPLHAQKLSPRSAADAARQ